MSLEYVNIDVGDRFKISPSSFASFPENPKAWYEKNVTKVNQFRGNTNTVIGTIIHNRIENWFNEQPIDVREELEYVASYEDIKEVDSWKVEEVVESLWTVLEDELPMFNRPSHMEQQVLFDIPNSNYTIAGTYDYRRDDEKVLGDIKTSSKTPKAITLSHRTQLCLYELAMRSKGIHNEFFEVMYIVKLKKPKVVVIKEPIDEEYLQSVKDDVKTMIERIELVKERPELLDVVFFRNKDSYIQ